MIGVRGEQLILEDMDRLAIALRNGNNTARLGAITRYLNECILIAHTFHGAPPPTAGLPSSSTGFASGERSTHSRPRVDWDVETNGPLKNEAAEREAITALRCRWQPSRPLGESSKNRVGQRIRASSKKARIVAIKRGQLGEPCEDASVPHGGGAHWASHNRPCAAFPSGDRCARRVCGSDEPLPGSTRRTVPVTSPQAKPPTSRLPPVRAAGNDTKEADRHQPGLSFENDRDYASIVEATALVQAPISTNSGNRQGGGSVSSPRPLRDFHRNLRTLLLRRLLLRRHCPRSPRVLLLQSRRPDCCLRVHLAAGLH